VTTDLLGDEKPIKQLPKTARVAIRSEKGAAPKATKGKVAQMALFAEKQGRAKKPSGKRARTAASRGKK